LAIWVLIVALPTTVWPLNVPFQEHRAYLAVAGTAALTALAVVRLLDAGWLRPRTAAVVGAAAVVTAGYLIVRQGLFWSDPVRLWTHAAATAPASFRAHTNAGLALAAAGRWDEADAAVTSALALNSDYPPALVARGVMEQRRGRREAARTEYERAVALRADYVPALYNLGLLAQESNDPATAETWYRRTLAINPLHANSLLNLGVLLLMRERADEADAVFATARGASPGSPEVLYYSGVVAERRGRVALAQEYYREAWRVAGASGRVALAADAQTRLNAIASKNFAP
jgi:tetratricopeptide (TPR) repeat protein